MAAWQLASDRAAEQVSSMSPADWSALECDYSRLLDGTCTADEPLPEMASVIADLKAELREHAQLTEAGAALAAGAAAATTSVADGRAGQLREASRSLTATAGERLRPALEELRRRPGPISETDIDQLARTNGVSFRSIGQIIERTFVAGRSGQPMRTGAAS